MADKEVTLKLIMEGAAKAASDMKGVAKEAGEAAKATKSLAAADREAFQNRRSSPASADIPGRVSHALPWQAGMRALAPVATAVGVARLTSGFGNKMEKFAGERDVRDAAGMWGDMTKSVMHSIPIVGSFTQAIEKFADAAGGATAKLAAATRWAETGSRMIGAQGAVSAAERAARGEMFGYARTAMDSQIGAESARGFADFVAGGGSRMRSVDLDVERARFGVSEAEALAAQRRRELTGGLPGGVSDELLAERERAAAAASGAVNDRQRALTKGQGEFFTREKPLRADLAEAQADALVKEQQLIEARKAKEADLLELKKRQEAANQANLNLAQKQFDLAKAQIAVDQDRLGKMKGLAGALGGSQPGEGEEALRILQAIKAGGISSVSVDEAQFASRFAPGFIEQQQQIGGQANPLFGALGQFQPVGNIGGQIGDLEAKLAADNANAIAKLKKAQEAANKAFVSEIAGTLGDVLKLATQQIRNQVSADIRKGELQRNAAG